MDGVSMSLVLMQSSVYCLKQVGSSNVVIMFLVLIQEVFRSILKDGRSQEL